MAVATGGWVAVARRARRAEYVLKPLTLVVLIGAAVALRHGNPDATCAFTVAALVASLAGDVFLMVPREPFVAGLGTFLLAHLA
ncbi:MAG: lysoplasmalogenase family protein [Actinomycetota bacterium]